MINEIARWNRWGEAKLLSGNLRDLTKQLSLFINTKDVVALLGARRTGKTTILFQLMDELESKKIPKEAMLHINCEEPSFSPNLSIKLLDEIYETYRERIYPKGKSYLFIDEIQNIPDWERWVRARNESENIKIFITGSSSKLMSRELGTLLTGRHVSFQVYPLSFGEFLRFGEDKILTPRQMQNRLYKYMKWGGYPEVVLSSHEERKEILLKQYFDDILFKDIALRHHVRDLQTLRNLAVHLLTQTASLFSFNRIANMFGISLEMASTYCQYLQEAYLVKYLSHFSLKVSERNRNPQKVHAIDVGLRNAISMSGSMDEGRILESLICVHLMRKKNDGIFFINKENEVDFAVRKGNQIVELIQVALELSNKNVWDRELGAFKNTTYDDSEVSKTIVILGQYYTNKEAKDVKVTRAFDFLLN